VGNDANQAVFRDRTSTIPAANLAEPFIASHAAHERIQQADNQLRQQADAHSVIRETADQFAGNRNRAGAVHQTGMASLDSMSGAFGD